MEKKCMPKEFTWVSAGRSALPTLHTLLSFSDIHFKDCCRDIARKREIFGNFLRRDTNYSLRFLSVFPEYVEAVK